MPITPVTFKQAIELANEIGIVEEKTRGADTVILVLKDGSELHFKSEYDEPYSDNTPGDGIQLPTVEHHINKKK
jgi:hypothetical protein